MAVAVNNVASVGRVLVGLAAHDACGKPKIADFLTCLVHHFSPNEKSTTINCKVQDDLLLLFSHNEGNKMNDENKPSTGAVNDELGCVRLYVCSIFDSKPSGFWTSGTGLLTDAHRSFFAAFTRMSPVETTSM